MYASVIFYIFKKALHILFSFVNLYGPIISFSLLRIKYFDIKKITIHYVLLQFLIISFQLILLIPLFFHHSNHNLGKLYVASFFRGNVGILLSFYFLISMLIFLSLFLLLTIFFLVVPFSIPSSHILLMYIYFLYIYLFRTLKLY